MSTSLKTKPDYRIADLALAAWGRREVSIAETEMPGLLALRREFVSVVAPMPSFVESHDLWIALASNLVGSNTHLDEKTLRKRKHADNATSTVSRRSPYRRLRSRVVFAVSLIVLFVRTRHRSRRAGTGPAILPL